MIKLNQKARRLKPSETLVIKARAAELRSQGRSIIDLSIGEPDIETPEHIKEAALRAMREGKTRYVHAAGIPELREVIARKLISENSIPTDANSIVISNGGKQALYTCLDVLLEPGDEVIIPVPFWVSYLPMVEMAGGTPVFVTTTAKNGLKLVPEDLAAALTPRTKVVMINSPSNPIGTAYSGAELKALGDVIEKSAALVISDEIYEKITFGDFKHVSFAAANPNLAHRTITVNGFSKTYAMTGWRLGYACGPREVIQAMVNHQSQATSSINSISQYAGVAAVTGPQNFIRPMVDNYQRRVTTVVDILRRVPGLRMDGTPLGAFYVWCNFSDLAANSSSVATKGSQTLAGHILDQTGVAIVPGEAFGDDHCFRISVAAPDDTVRKGAELLAECLKKLAA